jgi:predicted ABC-type ATPase
MSAILEALKKGECFSFGLLAAHYEDCAAYWHWWWENQAREDQLSRPHLIAADEPVLEPTDGALFADTLTYQIFFEKFLLAALKEGSLPRGDHLPREPYRDILVQLMASRGVNLGAQRIVVFAGGGYGAGKSTILAYMAKCGALPLSMASIVGVDVFKPYLPEYEMIRRIGDGRASSVVQNEAKALADRAFARMVQQGRSFIWDSSMSDSGATLTKIQEAKARGYELHMVGVASSLPHAVTRAMRRAREVRRFAHPDRLEASHRGFARSFESYVPHFKTVMLFENGLEGTRENPDALLFAQKRDTLEEIDLYDEARLNSFLRLGRPQ